MRPDGFPTYGESEGRVSSTRLALPWRKVNSRTRSPTVTASSTSADMIRGVETLTSTPQASLNSHSLLGWLTRPTVRGTPNSVLARSEVTRLTLSSPVAAMTTSHLSSRASSSEDSSHESASSHSASGTRSGLIDEGSLSMRSTSWPFWISSRAIERPTAPAPAMATLMSAPLLGHPSALLGSGVDDLEDLSGRLLAHHQVDEVTLLDDRLPVGEDPLAEPVDPRDPAAGLLLEVDRALAHPLLGDRHLVDPDGAGRVAEVRLGTGGEQPPPPPVPRPPHRGGRRDPQAPGDP